MTLEDVAVIASMVAVPALLGGLFVWAVVAISRMVLASGRRSYAIASGLFGVLVVSGLASAVWLWGIAFDHADTLTRPPSYVRPALLSSLWVAAGAYAGFIVTGLLARRGRRRLTPTS